MSNGDSIYATYPETIPTPLLGRRHELEPRGEETVMESGRRRIRRQHEDSVELMEVQWNFTVDQYETFRDWFIDEITSGEDYFEMLTYELVQTPGYYVEVTRVLAFLDGTYSFSQSDNLVSVTTTLIVDSEEVGSDLIAINPEPPFEWPPVVLDYTECLDEFTVTFEESIDAYIEVYHGDSAEGPWDYYTAFPAPVGGRTSLTFGNYFQGTRWIQLRAFTPGTGAVMGNLDPFLPDPPMVEPPEISIDNLSDSVMAFPEDWTGTSGNGVDEDIMTVGSENRIYPNPSTSRPATAPVFPADLLFSDALVEIRKRHNLSININLTGSEFPQAVTLTEVTSGSVARFTVDGTDPTEGAAGGTFAGLHDSGDSAFAENAAHSRVLIARCFKDGCKSPPVYIAIDVTLNVKPVIEPRGGAANVSISCLREHWERNTPDCVDVVATATCPYPYVTGYLQDAAKGSAAAQALVNWLSGSYATNSTYIYQNTSSEVNNLTVGNYWGPDPGGCPVQYGGGVQQASGSYYAMQTCICSSVSFVNLDDAPDYCFAAFEDLPEGPTEFDVPLPGIGISQICGVSGIPQNLGDGFLEWAGRPWSASNEGEVIFPNPTWVRTTVINNYPD